MIAIILSLIYLALIGAVDYQVIFVFLPGWRLTTESKIVLVFLNSGAIGIFAGMLGIRRAKTWARKLVLTVVSLNLVYYLYVLYKDVIIEAIESYKYNRRFGEAPLSFAYLSVFLIFNVLFARFARKK